MRNNRFVIYGIVIFLCIIVVALVVYFQFFYSDANKRIIFGNNSNEVEAEDVKYDNMLTTFNSSFNNGVRRMNNELNDVTKIDDTKDIVYTIYNVDVYAEDKYDININIPYINIQTELVQSINKEIDNLFGTKANSVVQSKNSLSTYNMDYVAYANGNILSLVIKATLKEQKYPQRVIFKTYNYDVSKDRLVSLDALINLKHLNKSEMQNKINTQIDSVITGNAALAEAGYNFYVRDLSNEMYQLDKTDTYCIDANDNLYIIYAYGNNNFTTEVDIVIF